MGTVIFFLLYLTIGGLIAVPFTDVLKKHTESLDEWVLAIAVPVVAWPFILLNAFAIIYTHWGDSE